MPRESYVKPEVKSEILEPEALCGGGSPVGTLTTEGGDFWGNWNKWFGWCPN